uniref:Uncharacterized protein n=1 Tax=Ditylenchus dipsaci TaxID=166011 RepID=A0A915DNW8_9BILA
MCRYLCRSRDRVVIAQAQSGLREISVYTFSFLFSGENGPNKWCGGPPNGFGQWKDGSPSDVFSPNIMQMEKQEKKRSSFFKWFAIVAAVLCIMFMIATIGLAILLGVKLHQMDEVEIEAQKGRLAMRLQQQA